MILLLWSLLALAVLYWGYALAVLWFFVSRSPSIRTDAPVPDPPPLVSIILPARNEERVLSRCLESLSRQDYPNWEVMVVNDRSQDRTGAIAQEWEDKEPRIRAFEGTELPEGWLGKNWANYQGVQQAGGDWLLFTDADTHHHPGSLRGAMALALHADLDALTLGPFLECETFWEKVFQPAIYTFIAIHLPPYLVNRPSFPLALANGQYILIRRAIYDEIGGHRLIRDRIVDDLALAENLRRHGRRIWVANGLEVLRTRMYTSLSEIWHGWSKNLMVALGNRFGLIATAIALGLVSSVLPIVLLGLAVIGVPLGTVTLLLTVMACSLLLGVRAWTLIRGELSPLYALLHPLAALLLMGILVNSAIRSRSRLGVVWKGRVYHRPR